MQGVRVILAALLICCHGVWSGQAAGQTEIESAHPPSSALTGPPIDDFRSELEARVEKLEALTRRDTQSHGSGLSGGAELIFFKPCGEAGSNTALYVGNMDFLPAWRLWGGA
jgi:hypothetical protein